MKTRNIFAQALLFTVFAVTGCSGFLDENAKNINIEDHINTTLYQEALAEATAEFGSEAPDFYAKQLTFFNENNL